ncbi:MAG: ABC transporter ATP-binding protein [Candidatus Omnitrophota bacterium]|jgi:simple sugar transport system ATP-binding protein|nr:MAG: ABC transporter ATP-binding protein [Candidatus Omnitrophota bacterium]
MTVENSPMTGATPALAAQGIQKRFGSLLASDSVFLMLHYGRIHALLGENGAGKSTFVSIVYGLYPADEGNLAIDGQCATIRNPADALRLGIGLVQQHFSLIPSLDVLENIILGREIRSGLRLDRKKAEREIGSLLERYGLELNLCERVESLPIGLQQQVEIAKVLYRNARIMLFDEPTAALVTHEVDRFLQTLSTLKREGIAILMITHRLPEVMRIADDVTVLRKGKIVLQSTLQETSANSIAKAIIGEELPNESYEPIRPGPSLFQINNLSSMSRENRPALQNIALDVAEHEILGIAGVAGNGQEELIETILGLAPADSGSITLSGEEILTLSTLERRKRGISLIPQDRLNEGLLSHHSLIENFMLNKPAFALQSTQWLHTKQLEKQVEEQLVKFEVQAASPRVSAGTLSGGHQQRVVVARELMASPKLIIAHNPTRGLDLRASRFVNETLVAMCRKGAGMILFSSELAELFLICRRIAVMHRGEIVQIRFTQDWMPEELGKAMVGGA